MFADVKITADVLILFTSTDDAVKSSQTISRVSVELQSDVSESVSAFIIVIAGEDFIALSCHESFQSYLIHK
jgi:hypothetical protein